MILVTDKIDDDNSSTLTFIFDKKKKKSSFDSEFSEWDTHWQLRNRMEKKKEVRKFEPKDFVEKAERDLIESEEIEQIIDQTDPES